MSNETRIQFRRRLTQRDIILAPGAGDALSARLVEQAGFEAVYMSGFAVGATFGKPDVGLLTLTEMVERASQLCDSVSIPVIADADNGYGNAINVNRTVRDFERAGVAALQLEDQGFPKQCGSMGRADVITAAEMVGKIKAACDARTDQNLLLIARTDIAATEGMQAAIERAAMYAEAGADCVMALGPYNKEEASNFIRTSPAPVAYLNSESATMPMLPHAELESLGVKLLIYPLSLLLASVHAMQATLKIISTQGTTAGYSAEAMTTFDECNKLLGIEQIRQMRAKFEC